MFDFKFFKENTDSSVFEQFYNYLVNSPEHRDREIADNFLTYPIEDALRLLPTDDEGIRQQFIEWRRYNGNWWQDDEDIANYLDNIENAAAPAETYQSQTDFLSRSLLQNPTFSMNYKCDELKRIFLLRLFEDRVKHHFIQTADGVQVITYLEQL